VSPGEELLARAAAAGASDLAFDPQDDGSLWALARIDGVRQRIGTIPAADAATTIARLKAVAALPAYITDEAQDGRIDGRPYGVPGDVRVAVLPTVRGGRVALRLPAIGALPAPEQLGLPATAVAHLRRLVRLPQGLLVVTGPTGSGKSTTIHSLLA
jgi:type II secretory ATPase GspE/PulE/Tfp pilus assembly ATPase PilB-like protein